MFDNAGMLFALGLRLTKLALDGSPLPGPKNCYVTQSIIQIGGGLTFTENDAITQNNGRGVPCVSWRAPDTLTGGTLDPVSVCQPDPTIYEFLIGGTVYYELSEVQTLQLTGPPTAGNFTLTFDGSTTANITYNAVAAAVQSALVALPNIDTGDVTVTGGPLPGAVQITFSGQYKGVSVPAMTGNSTGLTGGTVSIVTSQEGGTGGVVGYASPELNTTPVPYGVGVEALANAVVDNAAAASLPYILHIWPRCRFRTADALVINAEDVSTPSFTAVTEKNVNFGRGPLGDNPIAAKQVWQYIRTDVDWTLEPGFVEIPA